MWTWHDSNKGHVVLAEKLFSKLWAQEFNESLYLRHVQSKTNTRNMDAVNERFIVV
jgi:hypothetical protein